MKRRAALTLFLLAVPAPEIRYFHFERPIAMQAQSGGQACMVVDPAVFAHASAGLTDLRVYQGAIETPYVVHSEVPVVPTDQNISPLNPGKSGGLTVFDAEMPAGTYSDIQLDVKGEDFLATVTVSGSQTQAAASRTKLGSFTIFDLTRQRLGRSTVLHLPESDFRYLHFQIAGPIAPDSVTGLSVTRPPKSQPKYAAVAETAKSTLKDRNSVFEFDVPAHTPVDRIVFVPGQNPLNFSRAVEIRIAPVQGPPADDGTEPSSPVMGSGDILRAHSVRDGHRIDEERLTVNAPEANFAVPAKWRVTIENHDDVPIQVTSIRLEMLARNLCFEATAGDRYALFYGDPELAAPVYDYAALFVLQQNPVAAQLGAEDLNPAYQPRPDKRPFTEKHPALLWMALVLVIVLLGIVAFRSFKAAPPRPS
ncbi:MAG: DUF3999 family protein [Terracidiphilus sp.]|jgi:hypothetical protein